MENKNTPNPKPAQPQWQTRDQIVGQPIDRTLLRLAVPAVMSTMFTVIFEFIDMFWIGKLGPVAIAALSASSFFVWMLRALGFVVATGAIAVVSRRSGEKDHQGVLNAIMNATGSTALFCLIITGIFLPIGLQIFRWIQLEPAVAIDAMGYGLVFLSGLMFVYIMITYEFVLRGIGDTRTPMIITGIALFLNGVLDPVFIFYFNMGLEGAALATIIAQAVGALLMTIVLLKKVPELMQLKISLARESIKNEFRQFKAMVAIGMPIGLSDAGFSLIYLLLSGIISIFGKEALAAVGIAHRFEAISFFIALGFSMAVAPMVGQYLGAGEPEKAKQSVYLSLKVTSAILFGISLLFFFFAPWFFSLFTNDETIIAHGADYLPILALSHVFLALEIVLEGAFTGAGDTKPPFYIAVPITFLRIPASYLLAVTLGLGQIAIWVVLAATTVLKGAVLLYWFNKGHWMKKKI